MRRGATTLTLTILCLASPGKVRADVPWVPYFDGEYLAAAELLAAMEYSWDGGLSVAFWGGLAYVYTRQRQVDIHTTGLEAAMEPRWYPAGHEKRGLFLGAYLGTGYMRTPERYRSRNRDAIWVTGVSRGLKLGYQIEAHRGEATRVLVEPYVSLSKAKYSDGGYMDQDSRWLKTLGLRLVWGFDL